MNIQIEKIKNIPPKILLKIIDRAKKYIKNNKIYKDMCKEYDVDENFIDIVPMKFGDLEVSARTQFGVITFNYKLLCNGDFFKSYHYIFHELEHFCQQCFGDRPTKGADEGNYLDNPFEEKGFQTQLEYIDEAFGNGEANKYVEHLLDHHDVKDEEEREEKKEILMERVDG